MAIRKKTGGRRVGTPNKSTAAVKAALGEAFDQMGGVDALVAWGNDNPGDFYRLWVRLLPGQQKEAGTGDRDRAERMKAARERVRAASEAPAADMREQGNSHG